jgi:glycosyltransferase involved in cell wall biosynthesis
MHAAPARSDRASLAGGDRPIELSVVMPCLDEAQTIGRCIDKARQGLAEAGVVGEVVVADNGSTDGSQRIAEEHGARVVPVAQRGYGCALRAGIAAARGAFVLMGDSDDSYDFSKLAPFVERLRAGDELVMGNRFQGGILPGAMPFLHRYLGNPVLTRLLNLFFRSRIGDAHCGLRALRKSSYEGWRLQTTGMEFASEMVVRAAMSKSRIGEVPIVLHPDGRTRAPHLRTWRDGWRHLRFLLILCPRWLYFFPAGLLSILGLALMIWLTPGPRAIGATQIDVHSMLLGALCVILGYQTLWMWAYAKTFGLSSGLLPIDRSTSTLWHYFRLERGVALGALLLALGLACLGGLAGWWVAQDFGELDVRQTLRWALWGFLLMVLGVQTIYGSFFLGMLRLAPSAPPPGVPGREAR